MGDDKILTYKDSILRRSDLDILKGPCYLNDEIIGFYFNYLSSQYDFPDILLVPPSVSFLLTNTESPENAKEIVEPMKLRDKKIIIFTVNNNNVAGDDITGGDDGGTHWSLLAYHRENTVFVHHDSMGGVNNEYANKLYDAIKGLFVVSSPLSSFSKSKSKGKNSSNNKRKNDFATVPGFVEYEGTPQQSNGYDCGVYVMAIARTICQWHSSKSRGKDVDWFSALEKHVMLSYVEMKMRGEVIELIEYLRKEASS